MKKTSQESMNDDDQRLHQSATANLTRTLALEYAEVASVSMPLDREQRARLSIVPGTSPLFTKIRLISQRFRRRSIKKRWILATFRFITRVLSYAQTAGVSGKDKHSQFRLRKAACAAGRNFPLLLTLP